MGKLPGTQKGDPRINLHHEVARVLGRYGCNDIVATVTHLKENSQNAIIYRTGINCKLRVRNNDPSSVIFQICHSSERTKTWLMTLHGTVLKDILKTFRVMYWEN